jgi:hypothetical protein
MGKFAAYLNVAIALAWVALFLTNDAPFVSPDVDLSDHLRGDKLAMAWAAGAICSRLYIALVNFGVDLRNAAAIVAVPYIAVDVYAALDTVHHTSFAWSFCLLGLKIMAGALGGKLKQGGAINALYCVGGIACRMNMEVNLPGRAIVNIGSASPLNGRDTIN